MKRLIKSVLSLSLVLCFSTGVLFSQPLWKLANENKDVLTFSTLFIARDVHDFLTTKSGLDSAVNWCKETGITRVFIETFRNGYYADRDVMIRARDRFLSEGFRVAGCVTPVKVGKNGVGAWGSTACYTNKATEDEFRKIFEYTGSIFDLIMIDDFLFTECGCEDCITGRGEQSWSKFRRDLLAEVSREHIIKPAKAVNPDAKLIIKYPLWYDFFQERGYDVVTQTKDYDYIWVGTETRDYDYKIRPGGEVQYNAFFIMRWLDGIGGEKTGGGWIDALGTTPEFYVEQARQTVLGSGKEIMLFHYGDLLKETNKYDGKQGTPKANVEALKKELPGLIELAKIIKDKPVKGIHLPKLPHSEPLTERYIFSFFGMLGLPLVPDHVIDEKAKSAIFSVHALKEPGFSEKLKTMLNAGTPVLITDGLAKLLSNQVLLEDNDLTILKVAGEPKSLLDLNRQELKLIRDKLMLPLGLKFDAPNKVSLYLLGENLVVIENFNDTMSDVTIEFSGDHSFKKRLSLPENIKAEIPEKKSKSLKINIPARSLVAFEYN
jgi:hypothetical protein